MSSLWRVVLRWWWIPMALGTFVLYSRSFNSFPVLEREHSVLADADAASFAVLITEFSPTRRYGNEYQPTQRSIRDIAQKHKTHHFLYFMVAGPLYEVLHAGRALLGLETHQALYEVNAVLGVVNVLLLGLLLRRLAPGTHPAPLVLLYAVTLSTWVYHAQPESWPLSTSLTLGFVWLTFVRRAPWWGLALYLGGAMVNNFLLGSLGVLILFREWGEGPWRAALSRTAAAAGLVIGTWLGALTVLSLVEPGLRPDHFIAYTLWFKRHMGAATLPLTDPYVWKSVASNLFVNAVASNQADPFVPQEALLLTLRGSGLGRAAVAAWVVAIGVTLFSAWRAVRATPAAERWAFAREPATQLMAFCAVFALAVVVMFFGAAFLYSMIVVPLFVLILAQWLPGRARWRAVLLGALIVLIAVNNGHQILRFRDALRLLD